MSDDTIKLCDGTTLTMPSEPTRSALWDVLADESHARIEAEAIVEKLRADACHHTRITTHQTDAIYTTFRRALGVTGDCDIDAAIAKHDAAIRSEYEEGCNELRRREQAIMRACVRPTHWRPEIVRCIICTGQGHKDAKFHIEGCALEAALRGQGG